MRILLDTLVFIWFVEDDPQLADRTKLIIEKSTNNIYLSIASIWEIAIKMQLKKLDIEKTIEEIIDLVAINGFELLPILPEHIFRLTTLDFHHRDPFDRIIISQGLVENQAIVSRDKVFDDYGVTRIWK
jgi:PIN domain nuclease of toxin-antitoxin system